jgi:SAM-dependent methyltransferase
VKRQFAKQYSSFEQWHWWFRGRQRILEVVLHRELYTRTSLVVASLGCGPSGGLTWLAPFVGLKGRLVGLDVDPLHARSLKSPLEYVVGKVEAVPFALGRFDLVLALDVLEHLEDDAAGLSEAAQLLKPSGLLLVTVPALPSLWGGQDVVSHHHRRYTKRTLYGAFDRAQLPRPSVTYFNTLLFPPVATVRWIRRAAGFADRARSDFTDNQPGFTNEILAMTFGMERYWVGRIPMPVGVSLLAIMRPRKDERSF